MLKSRMGYLSQRQRVIAENVANANTPGYAPRDLKPFSFEAQMQAVQGAASSSAASGMSMTHAGHMLPQHGSAAGGAAPAVQTQTSKDSETTLDGNSVVLEEEMMKMSQARMDYDAAVSFYQKALNMIQLATRAPGHG
jgi:flagellar basal-body rod protein FlgB